MLLGIQSHTCCKDLRYSTQPCSAKNISDHTDCFALPMLTLQSIETRTSLMLAPQNLHMQYRCGRQASGLEPLTSSTFSIGWHWPPIVQVIHRAAVLES